MRGKAVVWLAVGVAVVCVCAGGAGAGGWLWWRHREAAAADTTVRVPEISVVYAVPDGWVRVVTDAKGPEYLTSVGPPLSADSGRPTPSSICAVGEMVPGELSGQVWDAVQHGGYEHDPEVRIGETAVLGGAATVVDGPAWRYTFVPLDHNGRYVFVLAQWWTLSPQDKPAAIWGCDQVLASLQLS